MKEPAFVIACKHKHQHHQLHRGPLRRPTPGESLYASLHPNRRMFFAADIARMEDLDWLIAAGRIRADGSDPANKVQ